MPFEALLTLVPLVAAAGLAIGAIYVGYMITTCATARMRHLECHSA
jgi:hypothetical protein